MAEWPTPEFPMPVPVTRHHVFLTLPILNTPYSILSYLTFALLHRPQADLHLCTSSAKPVFPNHHHGRGIEFAIAHELAADGFAGGLV